MDNLESYCVVFADSLDILLSAKIQKNNQGVRLGIESCIHKTGANLSVIPVPVGNRQECMTAQAKHDQQLWSLTAPR